MTHSASQVDGRDLGEIHGSQTAVETAIDSDE
jgi:hypothetical protein